MQKLEREEDGFYAMFESQSGNGEYKTKFWTSDKLALKKGMITCNCKGWIFNRKCRHQEMLKGLLLENGVVAQNGRKQTVRDSGFG